MLGESLCGWLSPTATRLYKSQTTGWGSIHPYRPPTASVCGACANGRNDSAVRSALKARLALERAFRLMCRDDSGQRTADPGTTGGRPRGCPDGAAGTAGSRIEY